MKSCVRRPDRPNIAPSKYKPHDLVIQPAQRFLDTTGEIATNANVIIDSMDLLHGGNIDGLCIVSPGPTVNVGCRCQCAEFDQV